MGSQWDPNPLGAEDVPELLASDSECVSDSECSLILGPWVGRARIDQDGASLTNVLSKEIGMTLGVRFVCF